MAINQIKGLITFFKKYREEGFKKAKVASIEIASQMNIEPVFREKRVIRRKRQFDENVDNEVIQSPEESFRTNFFLHIIDQAISSFSNRFEQLKVFEETFKILFGLEKLKSIDDNRLKEYCLNLESFLKHRESCDIDSTDLFLELRLLREILDTENESAIKILNYLKRIQSFPNAYITYRILLTAPVTVASAERSFSKLKLIKSYLRSTMSQERLSGLATLSIERDFLEELEYKDLISNFASQKARKIKFN